MILTKRRNGGSSGGHDSRITIEEPQVQNYFNVDDDYGQSSRMNISNVDIDDRLMNDYADENTYQIMHEIQHKNQIFRDRQKRLEDNSRMKLFVTLYVIAVMVLTCIVIGVGVAIYGAKDNTATILPLVNSNMPSNIISLVASHCINIVSNII